MKRSTTGLRVRFFSVTVGRCSSGIREEDSEDAARADRACAAASKGNHMTITFEKLKARLLANPKVKAEYDALAPEFEISAELVRARLRAGLSQAELAARMGTSQSTIARLESGQALPSTKTLLRYAQATGSKFHVRLFFGGLMRHSATAGNDIVQYRALARRGRSKWAIRVRYSPMKLAPASRLNRRSCAGVRFCATLRRAPILRYR
jgi:transcriptional regulator with XRE-family HTH domain